MHSRLFLLLVPVGLLAQQPSSVPPAGDPVIRLDVQQVLVPVIVTDKKGHHVDNLHASDFRILEDGVPQQIAAFSTEAAGSVDDVGSLSKQTSRTTAVRTAGSATPRRTYVICIDTLHAWPADAARLRAALEKLFHDEKGTDAQYVLVGIGRQLQVLQTATTNPLAVLLKIRGAGFQAALGGTEGASLAAQLSNLNRRMEDFCRRCACGVRSNQRSCDSEIETLKQSVDSEAERWTALSNGMASQFKSVVDELAKLPTGRTLILVSAGFNLNPLREFYEAVAAWLPASPQFRVQDTKELQPGIQDALKVAAERNVIIYAVDSRGNSAPAISGTGPMDAGASGSGPSLQTIGRASSPSVRSTTLQATPGPGSNVPPPAGSATMEQLANATGGVYRNGQDLSSEFRGALADGREYYVLAYAPNNRAADGKFRRISVEVTGKDLHVRAKAGYWAARSDQ